MLFAAISNFMKCTKCRALFLSTTETASQNDSSHGRDEAEAVWDQKPPPPPKKVKLSSLLGSSVGALKLQISTLFVFIYICEKIYI